MADEAGYVHQPPLDCITTEEEAQECLKQIQENKQCIEVKKSYQQT